jgi:hypothetical protein
MWDTAAIANGDKRETTAGQEKEGGTAKQQNLGAAVELI